MTHHHTSRALAIVAAALLTLVTIPAPASASGHMTDPVFIGSIPISVTQPSAGAGYRLSNGCAGGLDTAPCIRIEQGAWVQYTFTITGTGGRGIDYIQPYYRGQSWDNQCQWRLTGPGVDETTTFCPSSPNVPTEPTASWFFRKGYAPGSYTLHVQCTINCNYIWLAQLELRTYYFGLRGFLWEVEPDYFPEPGRLPGVPSTNFARACVVTSATGSEWYPDIQWTLSWGDGKSESGTARLEPVWWQDPGYWGQSICHNYDFPANVYQVCLTVRDNFPRQVNTCITVSGGINAQELVEQGVEYVVDTVT